MKIRVKTWHLAVVLLLSVLLPVGFVSVLAQAPAKPLTHLHRSLIDVEDAYRVATVTVTEIGEVAGETTVYYKREDSKEVILASVVIDSHTKLPDNWKKHPEGKYILTYCGEHHIAYEFIPLP